MFVLIFIEYAMVHCFLPNKSAQTAAVLTYPDTLNATGSCAFSGTEGVSHSPGRLLQMSVEVSNHKSPKH